MGEFESEWIDVTSGVPQESVLDPLLFLLCMIDLEDLWMSKFYADNCKIIGKEVDTSKGVQKVLTDVDALGRRLASEAQRRLYTWESGTKHYIHHSQTRRHKIGALKLGGRKGSRSERGQQAYLQ